MSATDLKNDKYMHRYINNTYYIFTLAKDNFRNLKSEIKHY